MGASIEIRQTADLRDYLAPERTLLASVRTGMAMMGFGFVVARFGLSLREFQVAQPTLSAPSYGLSRWFGIALIAIALIAVGMIVNLFAGWNHARLVRELDRSETTHSHPAYHSVAIAIFLALVGLAMAIYRDGER